MIRFIDAREDLPRHETKKFSKRSLSDIKGVVVHHTGGGDDVHNTARYHVGPNHVSESGCPALLYTFYINKSGIIYWANDLEDVTWSQGGHGSPVPKTHANNNFLAIVCAGNYSSDRMAGPPFAQVYAFFVLWAHLVGSNKNSRISSDLYGVIDCPVEAMWGHHNFGKPSCPGPTLTMLVDSVRAYLPPEDSLVTVRDWQEALNAWGSNLVVDGVWGALSREQLTKFQRSCDGKLVVDGIRGPLTEAALIAATR